jgi:hypothetical protein
MWKSGRGLLVDACELESSTDKSGVGRSLHPILRELTVGE